MSAYSKDLCILEFTETTNLGEVKHRVLNAFLEGIYCFQFRFHFHKRIFEDRVALPKDADEAFSLEMAEHQFQRFTNTVAGLVTKRL